MSQDFFPIMIERSGCVKSWEIVGKALPRRTRSGYLKMAAGTPAHSAPGMPTSGGQTASALAADAASCDAAEIAVGSDSSEDAGASEVGGVPSPLRLAQLFG